MNIVLDALEYLIFGLLLLYLCKGALEWRESFKPYKGRRLFLFLLFYFLYRIWTDHSPWLDRLLYGEDQIMRDSGNTIIKIFIATAVYFIAFCIFFEGTYLARVYQVLLYQAILENTKFLIFGFWNLGISAYIGWYFDKLFSSGKVDEEVMYRHVEIMEQISFLIIMAGIALCSYLVICLVRKYRRTPLDRISRQGILFLMLSPLVGIAFAAIMRGLMFKWTEQKTMEFLYDRNPWMYAAAPVMSFFCLALIVVSIRLYEELMQAEEEKSGLIFYRHELTQMQEHIREVERIYDGIRGMRHDMNNYIADMEQLIRQERAAGVLPEGLESEAQNYLEHMKNVMEDLTLHFQTGSPVIDVVLDRKLQECEKEGIVFGCDFRYPERFTIDAFDLGIWLNNALDNAIEASKHVAEKDKRQIKVRTEVKGNILFMFVVNYCDSSLVVYTKEHTLQTTKTEAGLHGIGYRNMERIAGKYHGIQEHELKDGFFEVYIMLQNPDEQGMPDPDLDPNKFP